MMSDSVQYFYNEGQDSKVTEFNPYSQYSQILCHHAWECGFVDAHRRSSRIPI